MLAAGRGALGASGSAAAPSPEVSRCMRPGVPFKLVTQAGAP